MCTGGSPRARGATSVYLGGSSRARGATLVCLVGNPTARGTISVSTWICNVGGRGKRSRVVRSGQQG